MTATKEKATLENSVRRNEAMGKYAKNTSTIVQPCDVGRGHVNQGHYTKNLNSNHLPHHGLRERANRMFMRLRNSGDLVVTAEKMGMMTNAVSRYPSICRLSYSEGGINKSFVKPGIIDENRQGVDLIAMFNTYKGERTIEKSKKWINDIPILARDLCNHKYYV